MASSQPTQKNNQVVTMVDDDTQLYVQGGEEADDQTNFLRLIQVNPRKPQDSVRFQVIEVPNNAPWVFIRCASGDFWRYTSAGSNSGKIEYVPLNPLAPVDNVTDPTSYW